MSKSNLLVERFYSPSRSHQLAAVKALLSLPVQQEQNTTSSVVYSIGLRCRPIASVLKANIRLLMISTKVFRFLWFTMPSSLEGETS